MIDFALVVLIWMVQLLIYPGFLYFGADGLARWHPVYTGRITWIVAPLMFAQAGLVGWSLLQSASFTNLAAAAAVAVAWSITFAQAVPLHQTIGTKTSGPGSDDPDARSDSRNLEKLVRVNWGRTVAWSLAFLLGLAA